MINPARNVNLKTSRDSNNTRRQKESKSFCSSLQANFIHLSISTQVMIVFTSLLIIFISILIFLRVTEVNDLLNKITINNYYKSVVINIIDVERNLKVKLDEINYQQHINIINSNPLFYQTYLAELTQGHITTMEIKVIDNSLAIVAAFEPATVLNMNYYGELNKIYPDIDFENNSKFLASARSLLKPGRNNLEFLVPFIYVNIPLLLQNLMLNGYYLENFYFMINSFLNGVCDTASPQQYAKYPLNIQESRLVTTGLTRYYDTNIEPVSLCGIDKALGDKEVIKRNNWFYIYEQEFLQRANRESFQRMLIIRRIQSVYRVDNYFVNFRTFAFAKSPTESREYYLTVGQKFNRDKSYLPFLMNKSVEQPYEFVAIINSHDFKTFVSKDVNDGLFYYDYNIDDSDKFLINTPTILQRLYQYSMLPREMVESNVHGINPRSLLLTYEAFEKISSQYYVNKKFTFESNFFNLINFFNNFFRYSKYEETTENPQPTPINHKCPISNLTDYYSTISPYYNCLEDICFYKNCSNTDPYYSLMAEENFVPNCHCLPLYCNDNYTITDGLPNVFKEQAFGINFYESQSFIQSKTIECRANFYFKDPNEIPFSFITKSWMTEANLFNNTDIFFLYMVEEKTTNNKVIDKMALELNFVKRVVFTFFFIIVVIVTIVFNKCMFTKINNFKNRIHETKELHRLIIISSQSELEDDKNYEISEINQSEVSDIQRLTIHKGDFVQVSDIDDELVQRGRYYDELQCIISIIKDNIDDFNIEFNINKNYYETNKMVKDFITIAKKKYYVDKILPGKNLKSDEEGDASFNDSFEDTFSNTSLNIIYELLSTELIDFNDYKYNFYFKENSESSMLNFYDMIETHLFNQQVYTNELTDPDKLEIAIQYYQNEIHKKWKDVYDKKMKSL
jgi:hypothetical protein